VGVGVSERERGDANGEASGSGSGSGSEAGDAIEGMCQESRVDSISRRPPGLTYLSKQNILIFATSEFDASNEEYTHSGSSGTCLDPGEIDVVLQMDQEWLEVIDEIMNLP